MPKPGYNALTIKQSLLDQISSAAKSLEKTPQEFLTDCVVVVFRLAELEKGSRVVPDLVEHVATKLRLDKDGRDVLVESNSKGISAVSNVVSDSISAAKHEADGGIGLKTSPQTTSPSQSKKKPPR